MTVNSFLAMIFEKDGDNAYWFYNDAFGFNGEPDGRFFTQNNGNVVRKPAQLDYHTENGIKYRIGLKSTKLPVAVSYHRIPMVSGLTRKKYYFRSK